MALNFREGLKQYILQKDSAIILSKEENAADDDAFDLISLEEQADFIKNKNQNIEVTEEENSIETDDDEDEQNILGY